MRYSQVAIEFAMLFGGKNRRKYDRLDFSTELIVHAAAPDIEKTVDFYAFTINISQGGI